MVLVDANIGSDKYTFVNVFSTMVFFEFSCQLTDECTNKFVYQRRHTGEIEWSNKTNAQLVERFVKQIFVDRIRLFYTDKSIPKSQLY